MGYGYDSTWTNNKGGLTVGSAGTVDLWDTTNVIVDALNGSGTITRGSGYASGSGTLTIGVAGGSGTFSGQIALSGTNAVTLVKTGAGLQVLSGANTYTGGTTISGGTLLIGGSGYLGGGNYSNTISNSGALVFNTSHNQTLAARSPARQPYPKRQ